jgi:hypothetical protein
MSKVAFVILASGDNPESLGRVVNALIGAYEMMESGDEVKIIFDGAGTEAAAALSAADHKCNDVFKLIRNKVSICNYCASAYGVTPQIGRLIYRLRLILRDTKASSSCLSNNIRSSRSDRHNGNFSARAFRM